MMRSTPPSRRPGLAAGLLVLLFGSDTDADETSCLDGLRESVWVESVPAGDEVILTDGRRLRLSGVEVPRPMIPDRDAAALARGARDALADRVEGRESSFLDLGDDRWGRRRGHLVDTETGHWVEGDLVDTGWLRVRPSRDDGICTRALLDREAPARETRRGLWGASVTALRPADRSLLADVGNVVVAAGEVRSIGRSNGRTWLNFGDDIARDFAVVMNDNDRSRFERAGIALDRLRGRRVVVRGVVLRRGEAPRMAIDDPAALEPTKR